MENGETAKTGRDQEVRLSLSNLLVRAQHAQTSKPKQKVLGFISLNTLSSLMDFVYNF